MYSVPHSRRSRTAAVFGAVMFLPASQGREAWRGGGGRLKSFEPGQYREPNLEKLQSTIAGIAESSIPWFNLLPNPSQPKMGCHDSKENKSKAEFSVAYGSGTRSGSGSQNTVQSPPTTTVAQVQTSPPPKPQRSTVRGGSDSAPKPKLSSTQNARAVQKPDTTILGKPFEDIKKYNTLGKELGRGQFGVTYLCTENATGMTYTCKSILKRKLVSKADREDMNAYFNQGSFLHTWVTFF